MRDTQKKKHWSIYKRQTVWWIQTRMCEINGCSINFIIHPPGNVLAFVSINERVVDLCFFYISTHQARVQVPNCDAWRWRASRWRWRCDRYHLTISFSILLKCQTDETRLNWKSFWKNEHTHTSIHWDFWHLVSYFIASAVLFDVCVLLLTSTHNFRCFCVFAKHVHFPSDSIGLIWSIAWLIRLSSTALTLHDDIDRDANARRWHIWVML